MARIKPSAPIGVRVRSGNDGHTERLHARITFLENEIREAKDWIRELIDHKTELERRLRGRHGQA